MKEKVTLRYQGGRYIVMSLENRMIPPINTAVSPENVERLLLEAKRNKNLKVKITG